MKVEKIFNNWTWPPDEGISFSYLIVLVMPIPNCENCSFGHSQKLPYMTRFACDLNQLASWVDTLWLLLEKRATVIKDMEFKSKMQPIWYIATALKYSVGSFGKRESRYCCRIFTLLSMKQICFFLYWTSQICWTGPLSAISEVQLYTRIAIIAHVTSTLVSIKK